MNAFDTAADQIPKVFAEERRGATVLPRPRAGVGEVDKRIIVPSPPAARRALPQVHRPRVRVMEADDIAKTRTDVRHVNPFGGGEPDDDVLRAGRTPCSHCAVNDGLRPEAR
ncbi:hypothetical protein [Trueperella pyogenes]|uniref:hypothetical protein n=1 Tax=Trueperella pyogenes TaxID=1661 RepID=UPI00130D9A5A|nr:hypothetical protein [Trueperella pyogenes]